MLNAELSIDTSNSEEIIVGLGDARVVENARHEKAQKLLSVINNLLKKRKMGIREITSITVNTGPGSFTGLRVGLSVANALGWALGIPVNGKNVSKEPLEPVYR